MQRIFCGKGYSKASYDQQGHLQPLDQCTSQVSSQPAGKREGYDTNSHFYMFGPRYQTLAQGDKQEYVLRSRIATQREHAMPLVAGRRLHKAGRLLHAAIAVTAITGLARSRSSPFAYPVPRMQQDAVIEPEQCEEIAYDCWERARVDENVTRDEFAKVRTVFGYGSLIFNPGFPYQRMYPACVRGYLRRFWQMSCDHRGTPEFPGAAFLEVRRK